MGNNKKEIAQSLVDKPAQEAAENLQEEWEELQKAANVFLNLIYAKTQENEEIKRALSYTRDLTNAIMQLSRNANTDATLTKAIFDARHIFESALVKFLNKTLYFTWVDDTGNIFFYDEVAATSIYKRAQAPYSPEKKSDSATAITAQIKNMQAEMGQEKTQYPYKPLDSNEVQQAIFEEIEEAQQDRKDIYQLVRYRYDNSDIMGMHYKSTRTWWWWLNKKKLAHTSSIANRGRIGEAYVEAVIQQDPKVKGRLNGQSLQKEFTNQKVEQGLQYLYLNHYDNDSVPAVVKGDVVLNKTTGEVHLAVKSRSNFDLGSATPYIYAAEYISKTECPSSKEVFKRALAVVADKGAKIVLEKTQAEAEEYIDEEIEKSLKNKQRREAIKKAIAGIRIEIT